jgi:soluble lytic murein transglycosylase-like protein
MRRLTLQILAAASLSVGAAASRAYCFDDAARRYGIEPNLLRAIAAHESQGASQTTVSNSNGSVDRGLMGINSVHLPDLAAYGINARSLYDPCTNVMAGAWLLKKKILRHGYTWNAVGAYHSETPARNADYQRMIYRQWLVLLRGKAGASPVPVAHVVGR